MSKKGGGGELGLGDTLFFTTICNGCVAIKSNYDEKVAIVEFPNQFFSHKRQGDELVYPI